MKMLSDEQKNLKKNIEKAMLSPEMLDSFTNKDLKNLIEIWHCRSLDKFYKKLKTLKDLTDEYYNKIQETNPFLFVMLAYCIDGDKSKSIEKSRQFINLIPAAKSVDDFTADKIVNTFVDLEMLYEDQETYDKTLFDLNSTINISDYFELVLCGFDDEYGVLGKFFKFSTDNNKTKIHFTAICDNEDLAWLKKNLFTKETKNLDVYLRDINTDVWYGLIFLCDCNNFEYINNIAREATLSISFEVGSWYMCASTGDKSTIQFIDDIKKNIENTLSKE